MATAISVRLDSEAERAQRLLESTSRSARPASLRPEVEVTGGLTRVVVEQLGAVDVQRLGRRVRGLAAEEMWSVDDALAVVLGLD